MFGKSANASKSVDGTQASNQREKQLKRARKSEHSTKGYPQKGDSYEEAIKTPASLRDNYVFIRELGHGAQGHVYLAKRRTDNARVAIKQLNIESVKNWKTYDLFKREGNVLTELNIPGVAKCYETQECLDDTPACAYIVQEYIEGKSIQTFLNEGRRFKRRVIYDIVLQILDILEQLQKHLPPIIHRDIKPSNIILTPTSGWRYHVTLIDFGAVSNPQIQGGGSTVAGTFGYMAPELMMGKPELASDIYSLGAVLVYMLSGRSPAEMPVKDFHLLFEPDVQFLDPNVVSVLRRMLEPDAKERLIDIDILRQYFNSFIYHGHLSFDENASLKNDYARFPGTYEKALETVSDYGQPGNIELWQRLPDAMPRTVPLCHRMPINHTNQLEYQDRVLHSKLGLGDIILFLFAPFILLIVATYIPIIGPLLTVVVVPALVVKLQFFISDISTFQSSCLLYLLFLIINFIFWRFLVHLEKRSSKNEMMKIESAKTTPLMEKTPEYEKIRRNILQNGRKTIARIIDIQYIPSNPQLVKDNLQFSTDFKITIPDTDDTKSKPAGRNASASTAVSNDLKHQETKFLVNFDVVTFRVQYAFNPPDDLRNEDIFHSFDMHRDPSELLHIGDALPILYLIERKVGTRIVPPDTDGIYRTPPDGTLETVYSMPYPIPLNDPLTAQDIIAQTQVKMV